MRVSRLWVDRQRRVGVGRAAIAAIQRVDLILRPFIAQADIAADTHIAELEVEITHAVDRQDLVFVVEIVVVVIGVPIRHQPIGRQEHAELRVERELYGRPLGLLVDRGAVFTGVIAASTWLTSSVRQLALYPGAFPPKKSLAYDNCCDIAGVMAPVLAPNAVLRDPVET